MTAPDSRDSVERIAEELRAYDGDPFGTAKHVFRGWADRLQALARGPQQAGGEDGVEVAPLYVELEIEAALGHVGRTSERLMRMAAEAKALLHRAETAEAALREAGRDAARYRWLRKNHQHAANFHELGRLEWYLPRTGFRGFATLDVAIDAAIEQANR